MTRIAALTLLGILLQAALAFGQQASVAASLLPPVAETPRAATQALGCLSDLCGGCCWRPEPPLVWGNMEFLIWQFNGARVPLPLVTQATNPADPNSGKLTSPETVVLLGADTYNPGARYGGRFTLGRWLDDEGSIGVESNFLFISPRSTTQTTGSNGAASSPTLAFPFFNAGTGLQDANVFAGPTFPGSATLRIASDLQGAELNLVGNLIRRNNVTLTGLLGFRYLRLKEDLEFNLNNSDATTGHFFSAQDTFTGTNNYYAGQIGWRAEYRTGRWIVDVTNKVAFGVVNQAVDVSGTSTAVNPGFPASFNFANAPGGTFALPTNLGHHTQDVFGVLPEVDVKIGYNISTNVQAFVAYSFLYLNNVARPGAALDGRINTSQQPFSTPAPFALIGASVPAFTFSRSEFWAQGISFGMEFKF